MKAVLINPAPEESRQIYDRLRIPVLGIGYLAAALRERGVDTTVVDAKMERLKPSQTASHAAAAATGRTLVGVTAMTHEIVLAHEIAARVKELNPDALTAVGGAHSTALPEQTLREFSAFDFSCFGEGEETILELASRLDGGSNSADGVAGIAWRDGGRIAMNPPRDWIRGLDALPLPAWDLFPRTDTYPLLTNRGCPHKCVFCMRVLGEDVRHRSNDGVMEELHTLVDRYGARNVTFRDENFGIKRAPAMELLDRMIAEGVSAKIQWTCQLRVNVSDAELFKKMKAAGCTEVGFGVESGNREILRAISKGITPEMAVKAVNAARGAGLETAAFFIIGHPNETKKTALDTINFAARLNPTRISVGIMVPYPGTLVAEMAERGEGGYCFVSRDWRDFDKYLGNVLELKSMSRREMEKLQASAFLKLYLLNFRFIELFKLLLGRRKEIFSMLKKWLGGRSRTA